MRTGLLVYNPDSGRTTVPDYLDDLLAHSLNLGLQLIPVRLSRSPENSDFLIKMICVPWVEFIIVSGGDGTLSSLARFVLTYRPSLPMGVIPSGTSNDFADSLHIPADVWDCINIVAENNIVNLDVGRVNGDRIFLSTCAAGMFVNISFTTNSQLKKNLGLLAYYISALGELPNIRPFSLKVEADSVIMEDNFLLFLLINGSQAAGFTNLYPKAEMNDGYMDLLLIGDVPPLDLPNLLVEIINRENIDNGRWLKRLRARHFKFSSAQPLITTLDGEEGLPLPFEVEIMPQALNVYVRGII